MDEMINEMEKFLSQIEFNDIDLDDDVIKYLQRNKEDWLQSFYNPKDMAEIWCVVIAKRGP